MHLDQDHRVVGRDGFGPRVHVELDKDSNLENMHLDEHP